MNNVMSQAVKRQLERPDIHKQIAKVNRGESFDQATADAIDSMVADLKKLFPKLDVAKLARLIGVSRRTVASLPFFDEEEDNENPASAASELAALREHHPGGYKDHPDAVNEPTGIALFAAPLFQDRYRRADQSHTIKRPVTLATRPYEVAA